MYFLLLEVPIVFGIKMELGAVQATEKKKFRGRMVETVGKTPQLSAYHSNNNHR